MRACWAVTLLVLVQPSPASCATCRGTSVVPRVLALTHRHLRKSPSVRQPFAEISGSISFSSLWFPFPETVSNFVCHFKGSVHLCFSARCYTSDRRQCIASFPTTFLASANHWHARFLLTLYMWDDIIPTEHL